MKTETEKFEMMKAASEKLKDFNHPVRLNLDIVLTVGIIGNLQLALRHEQNTGEASRLIEKFVRDLIEQIDPMRGVVFEFLMMGMGRRNGFIKV